MVSVEPEEMLMAFIEKHHPISSERSSGQQSASQDSCRDRWHSECGQSAVRVRSNCVQDVTTTTRKLAIQSSKC